MSANMSAGDFTGLANDYSQNRPDYSHSVLLALIGLTGKQKEDIDFLDVGAGTGIWTRMVANEGVRSAVAVEPNDDMFASGVENINSGAVKWLKGSAEATGLADNSFDWVTMASSFHWADFDKATKEFHRILRSGGYFTALWNPRLIEGNPLLVEIEAKITELNPNVRRLSSGRSGLTVNLNEKLSSSRYFGDVIYIEGTHSIQMSTERYIGAWRSVNDLRVQLGNKKFDAFITFVQEKLKNVKSIDATYLTRSWSSLRLD